MERSKTRDKVENQKVFINCARNEKEDEVRGPIW